MNKNVVLEAQGRLCAYWGPIISEEVSSRAALVWPHAERISLLLQAFSESDRRELSPRLEATVVAIIEGCVEEEDYIHFLDAQRMACRLASALEVKFELLNAVLLFVDHKSGQLEGESDPNTIAQLPRAIERPMGYIQPPLQNFLREVLMKGAIRRNPEQVVRAAEQLLRYDAGSAPLAGRVAAEMRRPEQSIGAAVISTEF